MNERRIGRMKMQEGGEIQQKPTTRHQAGEQGVNQAASPWLGAGREGEVAHVSLSLHRRKSARTVDPKRSPPNPDRKGILQLVERWFGRIPPTCSSWAVVVKADHGGQGSGCLAGGALSSSCFPSRHSALLLASSFGIIIDPLDEGWEAGHGGPRLRPGFWSTQNSSPSSPAHLERR